MQWRKAESLPTKIWNKTGLSTLTTLIQHSTGSPSHSKQTKKKKKKKRKEITGIQIGREEVKLSLYAEGMILQIESPKSSTQKVLELMNKFSKYQDTRLPFRNQLHFCIPTMKY